MPFDSKLLAAKLRSNQLSADIADAWQQAQIPKSVREQEKGLGGGLDLFEVGGMPINATDVMPTGLGALGAKLAVAGKGAIGAMPMMVGAVGGGGKMAEALNKLHPNVDAYL